jgi:hypothetical protein
MPEETSISRRKLLKRAGIGAAAVWSVPFLSSTASADVGIESLANRCHNADNSPSCPACSGVVCATKNGKTCFCDAGVKNGVGSGCCVCQGSIFCSDTIHCSGNGDCTTRFGRGWKCAQTCCAGGPVCVPPCGQGLAADAIGAGLTTNG